MSSAAAKSLQSCPTLCDPIDCSPPGSPVPGILQARTLEWVAIPFSNAWKWKVKVKLLSRVRLFATPWTAAYQAPPSMGFSKQEYWSGMPLPSPSCKLVYFYFFCLKNSNVAGTLSLTNGRFQGTFPVFLQTSLLLSLLPCCTQWPISLHPWAYLAESPSISPHLFSRKMY